MDTNLLEDFFALAREGNFSKAAHSRAVTQPAFSRRIQALEEWVGASLFDRSTHRIQLNAAGERFRPAASEIIRLLTSAREDARSAADNVTRSLHFASTHALSVTFFPLWLRNAGEAVPSAARIHLTADNMFACEQLMTEGKAHFLICHHHPAADWRLDPGLFLSTILGHDMLIPVANAEIAVGGFNPGQKYLAYTPESGIGRILSAVWNSSKSGHRPVRADDAVFSSHLASALVAMAREGRGIAWLPLTLVGPYLEEGSLVRLGGAEDTVQVEVRMFRSRDSQSQIAETFWKNINSAQKSSSVVQLSSKA